MRKIIAMGTVLLGLLATGALTAVSASGTSGGHFVTATSHAEIVGAPSEVDQLYTVIHGMETPFVCDSTSFKGTTTSTTSTEIELTASYSGCHTSESATSVTFDMNGCAYRLTGVTGGSEGTVDLICPAGKAIELTHPNCTIRIPPQTSVERDLYTTTTVSGKHAVTVDRNRRDTAYLEAGICVFLGTTKVATTLGAYVITARTTGNLIDFTST